MTGKIETVYTYSFNVWPNLVAAARLDKPLSGTLLDVFNMLSTRMDLELTESQFGELREDLFKFGFEPREISRTPYHESEVVL